MHPAWQANRKRDRRVGAGSRIRSVYERLGASVNNGGSRNRTASGVHQALRDSQQSVCMSMPGDQGSSDSMTHIGCQEPGTPNGDTRHLSARKPAEHSPARRGRPLARLPYSPFIARLVFKPLARVPAHPRVSMEQPQTKDIDKSIQPSWKIDMVHRQLGLCLRNLEILPKSSLRISQSKTCGSVLDFLRLTRDHTWYQVEDTGLDSRFKLSNPEECYQIGSTASILIEWTLKILRLNI